MKKHTHYDHTKIEKKWQKEWVKKKIYKTLDPKKAGDKPKYYVLDMFPYPSGEGLHVGHPKGYIATDVVSRMKRMQGHNVLHPMGFDAFGLPAEQYAIKMKTNPAVAVGKNVARYKKQLEILGLDYDWSREVNTTDPKYYKWTQWIFLKLLEKGLAYESYEPINWCPTCKTGLANEDLEDGKCERCGTPVEKKPMRQWVLKITDYADRMLADLDLLTDWPDHIKDAQRNWIGRSEGAEFDFKIKNSEEKITVFTTRADTLCGVTYIVLAPEHELVNKLTASNKEEIKKYVADAKAKTEIERTDAKKEKTGVQMKGVVAINPANGEEVPVWIADYVLNDYGTGAVMAVPAHDERDFEFAKKYNLPIRNVINPVHVRPDFKVDEKCVEKKKIVAIVEDGKGNILTINWKPELGGRLFLGGTVENNEKPEVTAVRELLEETGYNDAEVIAVSEETFDYKYFAHSKNVACRAITNFVHIRLRSMSQVATTLEENEKDKFQVEWLSKAEAEKQVSEVLHVYGFNKFILNKIHTDGGTLFNSGSYSGMDNQKAKTEVTKAFGKTVVKYKLRDWVFSRQRYWGEPIPVYHTPDGRVVPVPEKELPVVLPMVKSYEPTGTGESPLAAIEKWVNVPMKVNGKKEMWKRETNTMPQWAGSSWYYLRYMDPKNAKKLVDPKIEAYWNQTDLYVGGAEHATRHLIYARFWHKFLYDLGIVSTKEPFMKLQSVGLIMAEDGRKMSKRWGNVVNPDDIIATYGADTMRVYEMFMGPFDQAIAWNTQSMVGSRRFIERIWNMQNKVAGKKENITLPKDLETLLHQTIKKVTGDIEAMGFNTAISALMILLNRVEKEEKVSKDLYETMLKLIAPFAPHIADEIWVVLGNKKSIHVASWPVYEASKLVSDEVTIMIQVNGKVRGSIVCGREINKDEVLRMAKEETNVAKWLEGKHITKEIYVPGKLVSLVVDEKGY